MNVQKVLLIGPMPPAATDLFEARDDIVYETTTDTSEENLREMMKDVAGVTVRTAKITGAVIAAAENLRVVSRFGVGYDSVDVPALTARGIPLAIVGTANSVAVAEAAMYMMLELAKDGRGHDRAVRGDDWDYRLQQQAIEMWRKTLLIVGFGRIGTRLAARARAFEMKVLVADPYVPDESITAAGCVPVADFRTVLGDIDYLSLHLPLSAESANMIGAAELARMKPDSILVNTARGGIVDEAALHAALTAGRIRGAGLDVLALEPPAADNPLFALDSVILSPHIAGVSRESAHRMAVACAQNVLDALDGTLDPNMVVNREVVDG